MRGREVTAAGRASWAALRPDGRPGGHTIVLAWYVDNDEPLRALRAVSASSLPRIPATRSSHRETMRPPRSACHRRPDLLKECRGVGAVDKGVVEGQ